MIYYKQDCELIILLDHIEENRTDQVHQTPFHWSTFHCEQPSINYGYL